MTGGWSLQRRVSWLLMLRLHDDGRVVAPAEGELVVDAPGRSIVVFIRRRGRLALDRVLGQGRELFRAPLVFLVRARELDRPPAPGLTDKEALLALLCVERGSADAELQHRRLAISI